MNRGLQELVWERARGCCEYCLIPQEYDGFVHEIDHAIAKKHGGATVASNLVLACFPCNNHKGPNVGGLDPLTGKLTPLFNPRRHRWRRHFRWKGATLAARTPVGRVTIAVLEINEAERVLLRKSLIDEGVFPPSEG